MFFYRNQLIIYLDNHHQLVLVHFWTQVSFNMRYFAGSNAHGIHFLATAFCSHSTFAESWSPHGNLFFPSLSGSLTDMTSLSQSHTFKLRNFLVIYTRVTITLGPILKTYRQETTQAFFIQFFLPGTIPCSITKHHSVYRSVTKFVNKIRGNQFTWWEAVNGFK